MISEAKLFELIGPYVDGLELLIKSRPNLYKVPGWRQLLPQVKPEIFGLAQALQRPMEIEEPPNKNWGGSAPDTGSENPV